jgi:hypothetical protein
MNIIENSNDDFILIGDDVDKDPEIFDLLASNLPKRILRSYIHIVRNRPIPEGLIPYYTSADLALRELNDGRIRMDSAERVLDKMLEEDNLKRIFPKFSHCPQQEGTWSWQLSSPLREKASLLTKRFVKFCSALKH